MKVAGFKGSTSNTASAPAAASYTDTYKTFFCGSKIAAPTPLSASVVKE